MFFHRDKHNNSIYSFRVMAPAGGEEGGALGFMYSRLTFAVMLTKMQPIQQKHILNM